MCFGSVGDMSPPPTRGSTGRGDNLPSTSQISMGTRHEVLVSMRQLAPTTTKSNPDAYLQRASITPCTAVNSNDTVERQFLPPHPSETDLCAGETGPMTG